MIVVDDISKGICDSLWVNIYRILCERSQFMIVVDAISNGYT